MQRPKLRLVRRLHWPTRVLLWLALIVVAANLLLRGIGYWLAQPPAIHPADAIVVLGGYDVQRMTTALTLYQQGLAPEVWHTGYRARGVQGYPIDLLLKLTRKYGLPNADLYLLPSANTWEDGAVIAWLAKDRQLHSILVVTNWFHSRRALHVLEHHLAGSEVRIYYAPVLPSAASAETSFGPNNWWQSRHGRRIVGSELLKVGFYWLRYGISL